MYIVTRRNIFFFQLLLWLNTNIFAVNSAQHADNSCPNDGHDECYCNATHIECELRDDAARNVYILMVEQTLRNCEAKTDDLNSLLSEQRNDMEQNSVMFTMANCLQLPDLRNQLHMTYKAMALYSNQTFGSYAEHADGIRTLRIVYNTQDLKLPAKLFQGANDMTHLFMLMSGTEKSGNLYEHIFTQLANRKVLELKVFGPSKAFIFQPTNVMYPLKYLDLSSNRITVLPEYMFAALPALNYLNLAWNGLKILPSNVFAKQKMLLVLDLSVNLLDHLPLGLFRHTPLLWKLLLHSNRFSTPTSIIGNISRLRYLYKLDLSDNQLTQLQGDISVAHETLFNSFKARVASEWLVPLKSNLSFIFTLREKKFETQLVSTKEIYLRQNLITHFDMAWLQQAQLACDFVIDLSGNIVKHINIAATTFNATNSCGATIKLADNPLECDCKLTWLSNNNYLYQPLHLQCSVTPFENSTITQIQHSESCAWLPALCPAECACRLNAEALVINCDNAALHELTYLPRPEPFARTLSMLSLSHNRLRQLPLNATIGYANVTHLNASHNQLTVLRPTELPAKLLMLDVRHNRLEHLSAEFFSAYLNERATLQQLYLANNPWKCDCSAELLLRAIRTQRKRIADVTQLRCFNRPSVRLLDAKLEDFCETKLVNSTRVFISAAILIALLFTVVLYYKYQLPVHVWLYSHEMLRCCVSECDLDKDKSFDAFISYAHQDAHFVNQTLLPQLERGLPPFRICTHERNWLAGAYIPEQIEESIAQSCRTIIILSQHFIESDWARMEFRTAHQCALNEGRARIIIIKYGEVTQPERVDKELQAYLDMNTYLEWSDARFWQKLRYAMPHKRGEVSNAGMLELSRRVYVSGQEELSCL